MQLPDPEARRLWSRLGDFSFDEPGAARPFSARLARENGWSRAFARRAIDEYRRFVLLAVVAGHPVTPSDEVDQVWHLHLCYTRSYWDDLCRDVLGRPLHHGPTRGGGAERVKFDDWYARTLLSYERVFGHAPPPELWPPHAVRFADRRWRRVDAATTFLLPRAAVATAAVLPAAVLVGYGCSSADGHADWAAVAVLVGLAIAVFAVWRALGRKPGFRRAGGTGAAGTSVFWGGDGRMGVDHSDQDGGHDDSGGDAGCGGGCGGGCGD